MEESEEVNPSYYISIDSSCSSIDSCKIFWSTNSNHRQIWKQLSRTYPDLSSSRFVQSHTLPQSRTESISSCGWIILYLEPSVFHNVFLWFPYGLVTHDPSFYVPIFVPCLGPVLTTVCCYADLPHQRPRLGTTESLLLVYYTPNQCE